ncbi:hypothetical protein [Yinghuangia sp. YIM S09857]|uniref:hypothetical protein n=1 Tax=Yinghuangia sp. YIM S09857 TaxID=3436929 RepID=UPI003F52CDA8
MSENKCTSCGHVGLGEGYVAAFNGLLATGCSVWVSGEVRRGALGGVKLAGGQPTFFIEAFRCARCGHLELFANRPT